MNVAQYIVNFLEKHEVSHVFGYQGGAILKIAHEINQSSKINYIQNFHEQASAFCADAYARISKNFGVAIATSGPGATNLITGIANAYLDSIPVLFITGQEFSYRLSANECIRSNGFQDLNIVNIIKPITKYSVSITNPDDVPSIFEIAYHALKSERPGPVLIDIPIDIQFQEIKKNHPKLPSKFKSEYQKIDNKILDKFSKLIYESKKPLILAGGGINISNANQELDLFVKNSNIPVALTLNGLDVYQPSIGFSGLYGNIFTNLAVYHADLLIVLGARLGQHQVGKDISTYTTGNIIHIDIDENELGRVLPYKLGIKSDIKNFLKQANQYFSSIEFPDYKTWHEEIELWKQKYSEDQFDKNLELNLSKLIQNICSFFPSHTIITADVGQNQMWLAQNINCNNKFRLLNSSGLGAMGYSLPAAIGAKISNPQSLVVAFMGDGGFQINIQEMQLIYLLKLNIKIIVINNNTLGLIRVAQEKYFNSNFVGCNEDSYQSVNLKKIASAYEINYIEIITDDNLEKLQSIIGNNHATIIEIKIPVNKSIRTKHDTINLFTTESNTNIATISSNLTIDA